MTRKIRIDMIGLRYGRLVGIEYIECRNGHAHWAFRCDCGAVTVANGAQVRAGRTASCGCLHREITAMRLLRHGRRAQRRHDSAYRAWQEINTYCQNPKSPRHRDFGARGILVCPAWAADFEAFLADMGERPPASVLQRIDEGGDFEPGNCRWAPARSRRDRALDACRAVSARPPRHGGYRERIGAAGPMPVRAGQL